MKNCSFFHVFIIVWLQLPSILISCQPNSASVDLSTFIQKREEGWKKVDGILDRIIEPQFGKTFVRCTEYGLKADSSTNNVEALYNILRNLSSHGGGTVFFPAGQYFFDGPIHLRSNIRLHLEEGSRIFFSNNPKNYLPAVKVRWEGTVCYNYSPLIYGYQLKNVAITGKGTIDGAALDWSKNWRKKQNPDKDRLRKMGNDKIPEIQRVFANGYLDLDGDNKDDGFGDGNQHYLRPSLIELYECENILIDGITLKNSPFWTVHPVFSKNITIRGINVFGETVNDDGIDPDSCEDVLIESCDIKTHDDAISIKAGRDQDAWDRPGSRNIIIRNNKLRSGVNAICVGSEMSGGVENVFINDNLIKDGKHALNFKCNLDRGGEVKNIYIRKLAIDSCDEAMFIFRMDYHGYRGNNYPTVFSDFFVSEINCEHVNGTVFKIVGVPTAPIRRIFLENIHVKEAGAILEQRHTEEIHFSNVSVNGKAL